jgi:hypothetical protein
MAHARAITVTEAVLSLTDVSPLLNASHNFSSVYSCHLLLIFEIATNIDKNRKANDS